MNVYEIITNRICEQLEAGTIPWKKSWNAKTQAPRNFTSGKLYSGINVFILLSARFQSPYFLSFKQTTEKGGVVRKGEKGLPIVFWSTTEKEDPETGEMKKSGFLKYYTVFNAMQIDGLKDVPAVEISTVAEGAEEFDQAAYIVAGMPNSPKVKHGYSRACYIPSRDEINMPLMTSFTGGAEYYSTLFHELSHSVGHESRLNRKGIAETSHFGSAEYSKEELVAEFGSAFLCAEAAISPSVIENQAAYIQGWLKALKGDSKLLINAAAQAQKAADYIMKRLEVAV